MKIPRFSGLLALTSTIFVSFSCISHADDALFIGNSYTYGGPEQTVNSHGGVPKIVEAIATSKGKKLDTLMLTVGGKDWTFHLARPETDTDIKLKKWNWVILQDFSTEATHAGKPDDFAKNGVEFYKRIMANSKDTKVVLYETWSRPKGSPFYTGKDSDKTFVDIAEMDGEIQKNYHELAKKLEEIDPGNQVLFAPVGEAFTLCRAKYPDISLNYSDLHHASLEGDYLAALVIYATLYGDSPKGATHEFFGKTLDPDVATKLQEIAVTATTPKAQ